MTSATIAITALPAIRQRAGCGELMLTGYSPWRDFMKVYSCVKFYASRFKDEPEPRWPVDYDFQEKMSQRGDGIEALEDAFYRCVGDIKPGDVIGLDDGTLWRNDFGGWKQLP